MPAYRSDAEGEIRDAVVQKLRMIRPNARIMHEINILNGVNRVDVMAVDVAEIISVEIKSEKDKLARLADQMAAMRRVLQVAVAAADRKISAELVKMMKNQSEGGVLNPIDPSSR